MRSSWLALVVNRLKGGSGDGVAGVGPMGDPTVTPGSQAIDVSTTPARRLNRRDCIETVHDLLPGVTVDSNLVDSMPEDTLP